MARKKKDDPEVIVDIFGEDVIIEQEEEYVRHKVGLFDFMNDLNLGKRNLLRQDPECVRDFAPFIINRGMSMGIETILYANEMNFHCGLDKGMVYDFYIAAIRPGKRYNKWAKTEKFKHVDIVSEFYGLSTKKALEALALLADKDIEDIKQKINKGGKK